MNLLAKGLEALGIASVMIALVEGILGSTMWGELCLSVLGITVFFAGRTLGKRAARRKPGA